VIVCVFLPELLCSLNRMASGMPLVEISLSIVRYCVVAQSFILLSPPQLWDVRRKGCIFTYKGHTEVIKDIQFSPDGKWVATASSDCTIKVG
jgi:WD40 repeat protein